MFENEQVSLKILTTAMYSDDRSLCGDNATGQKKFNSRTYNLANVFNIVVSKSSKQPT